MNSMQIKANLKNISKKNTDFNTLLRLYMYKGFVEKLGYEVINEESQFQYKIFN